MVRVRESDRVMFRASVMIRETDKDRVKAKFRDSVRDRGYI